MSTRTIYVKNYPTTDPKLGRGVYHDSKSWDYRWTASAGLTIQDSDWEMVLSVLNQGEVGDCTAETASEMLGTPFIFNELDAATQSALKASPADNKFQLSFYNDEEIADGGVGFFKGEDNGSYGTTSGKVAVARKYISAFQHTFTANDALLYLSNVGPFSWGTQWKAGMDAVNETTGLVKYSGTTRGGHQLRAYKIDAKGELVWVNQTWGAWGYQKKGIFCISFADFEKSLNDQGDVTTFVPLSVPAPTPQPAPSDADAADIAMWAANLSWTKDHHVGENERAVKALQTWAKAKGLADAS